MNVFEEHGLDHLSSSQLTTFSVDPSLWLAEKLLGMKTPTSPAAMRGRAIETGVVLALMGKANVDDAIDRALFEFDDGVRITLVKGMSDAALKERDVIPDIIKLALPQLRPLGVPTFPADGTQHQVSMPIRFGAGEDDVIELRGYLDLVYPDQVIDLKTTLRMPSEMSWSHSVQHAIYSRAVAPKPVSMFYVTPKKTQFLTRTAEETKETQAQVRTIVQRMAAFLRLGDAETLRQSVPVIVDSWSWKGIEDQRAHFFGV